jgi:Chitin binding Peritrophin-A domain.
MQRHITEYGNPWLHLCENLKTWRHSSASVSKTFSYACGAEFLMIKKDSPCTDGDYSASQDCAKYLVCLWGTYQEFTCGPGLHWNSVSSNIKMSVAVLRVFTNNTVINLDIKLSQTLQHVLNVKCLCCSKNLCNIGNENEII